VASCFIVVLIYDRRGNRDEASFPTAAALVETPNQHGENLAAEEVQEHARIDDANAAVLFQIEQI
jgi:hypothetical protein